MSFARFAQEFILVVSISSVSKLHLSKVDTSRVFERCNSKQKLLQVEVANVGVV